MAGYGMRVTVPTPGRNRLTERLLADGVDPGNTDTWPEDVYLGDGDNFLYKREWRFTPTWESPCGLLIKRHGDLWGDTWINGEFHCSENDNPLFRCPTPARPCAHRLALPAGINCQFHRTDKAWSEEQSVEKIYERRGWELRRMWEAKCAQYPGWNGSCPNLKEVDMPDGSVAQETRFIPRECISMGCTSTQCVCRQGAPRDIRKANIFYDLYIERQYSDGLVPYTEKTLRKGLKVFDKPVAWTDAEICLKIWKRDPDSPLLPGSMDRLNAGRTREVSGKEGFFVRHHGRYNGHRYVQLIVEIRNVRLGRSEQKDMLKDLQDVQQGIEVVHESDLRKAAKAEKSDRLLRSKVKKLANIYANEEEHGMGHVLFWAEKPEMRALVVKEAEKILEKRRKAREKDEAKRAQVNMFEM